jgi:hypothetical protein
MRETREKTKLKLENKLGVAIANFVKLWSETITSRRDVIYKVSTKLGMRETREKTELKLENRLAVAIANFVKLLSEVITSPNLTQSKNAELSEKKIMISQLTFNDGFSRFQISKILLTVFAWSWGLPVFAQGQVLITPFIGNRSRTASFTCVLYGFWGCGSVWFFAVCNGCACDRFESHFSVKIDLDFRNWDQCDDFSGEVLSFCPTMEP